MDKSIFIVITIIILYVIVILLIAEVSHISVFGKIIKKKDLEQINLEGYEILKLSRAALWRPPVFDADKEFEISPYISKHPSLRSKWYIQDMGVVPRSSDLEKELDALHAKLLITNNKE